MTHKLGDVTHTPAPWFTNHDCTPSTVTAIVGGDTVPIACVDWDEWIGDEDTMVANIELISAAPELLAALKWALEQIDDDLDPDHQAALAAARAVVERMDSKTCTVCGAKFVPSYGEYARCLSCLNLQHTAAEIAGGVQ